MTERRQCPVCNETDPYPAWFCMKRAAGVAVKGEPCSYSREGHDRMTEKFATKQEAAQSAE